MGSEEKSFTGHGMISAAIALFYFILVAITNDFYVPPDYRLVRNIEAPVKAFMDDRHYIIIHWKSNEGIRKGGTFSERRSGAEYGKWRIANREIVPKDIIGKYLAGKSLRLKYRIEKEGKIPVITVIEFKLE